MNNKILLIDDDEELCELVGEYLKTESFEIEAVHDGEKGANRALAETFDLIVLDVMLPKLNGFDVLRKIRESSKIPILMLTARGEDVDRIIGLELGADDYLPKPFNPRELVARIKAILRRAQIVENADEIHSSAAREKLKVDDVEVDLASRLAMRDGEILPLTAVEFDLLVNLLRKTSVVITREELTQAVLGRRLSPFDRSIDMHISNLRKKLGTREDGDERIKTIRSVGYIYTVNSEQ
jgi:DNA-binding response OmpR family regulator